MLQDRKRTKHNFGLKLNLKNLIKQARRSSDQKNLQAVFSALDKAVKTNLIHANKAARLKSRLSKGISSTNSVKKTTKKKAPVKKLAKKSSKS